MEPIIGALVFGISLLIVCLFGAVSIILIRTAIWVQIAGEEKEKPNNDR